MDGVAMWWPNERCQRQSGGEDRVEVFDAMGFVDDNVLERNFLRGPPFRQHNNMKSGA